MFFTGSTSKYWNIGLPTYGCNYCGAIMWFEEKIQKSYKSKSPMFTMCCGRGRVHIPPYEDPPSLLYNLFHRQDTRSHQFLERIRSFNSMFAFTSMGGKIDRSVNTGGSPPVFILNGENYHSIGSLLPMPGGQPKFAQLYIYMIPIMRCPIECQL